MNQVKRPRHLTLVRHEPIDVDEELERLITLAADRLATAPTRAEKIKANEELTGLHALRSPEQIAKMERRFLK